MEILQFLLSYFLKEHGGDFSPILQTFMESGFDIKKTLSALSPDKIFTLLGSLMNKQNKSPTDSVEQGYKLTPISKIANSEILSALESVLSSWS